MPELLLDVKLGIPKVECPAGVADQWQESFKLTAQRINKKRLARVGTPESFSSVLAGPAAQGYKGYLDPTFTTRKGRTGAAAEKNQEIGVKGSFNKYDSKTRRAFDIPAGSLQSRFADSVDQAKKSFSQGMSDRTLRITGVGHANLGLAGIAVKLLTGDKQALSYLRGCDELIAGSSVNFGPGPLHGFVCSAFPGFFTQQGIGWMKSGFNPEVAELITILLTLLMSGLTGLTRYDNPDYPFNPDSSFYGWQLDPVLGPVLRLRTMSRD